MTLEGPSLQGFLFGASAPTDKEQGNDPHDAEYRRHRPAHLAARR
jgi:hypothetical protein